jgi:aspartate/methionine/tyrosine aminotransferase
MRGANTYLGSIGTTIFTVMSALANEHRSINLGQGFPDTEGPADVVQAAADALMDGRNQYPPTPPRTGASTVWTSTGRVRSR